MSKFQNLKLLKKLSKNSFKINEKLCEILKNGLKIVALRN